MPGPYINKGNYVYGVALFNDPPLPGYDCDKHRITNFRDFPWNSMKDDGAPYRVFEEPSYCLTCNRCNKIQRNNLLFNIVNISSSIDKVLTITLYGTSKNLDKTIKMKIGNKYCISYLTENGVQTVTGIFKELSPNMPDECVKYIGVYSSVTTAAYICLDCSTEGQSNKRLIYIASIRHIEELFDDENDRYKDLSQIEKIRLMVSDMTSTLDKINEYLEENNKDNEESNTDSETSNNNVSSNPSQNQNPPPSYILPSFYPYYRPPYNPPPKPPQNCVYVDTNSNNKEVISDDLVSKMETLILLMNTYITKYEEDNNTSNDDDNCDCNDSTP